MFTVCVEAYVLDDNNKKRHATVTLFVPADSGSEAEQRVASGRYDGDALIEARRDLGFAGGELVSLGDPTSIGDEDFFDEDDMYSGDE